jgi:hypothetical protein
MKRKNAMMETPDYGAEVNTPQLGYHCKFMIYALTGVNDDFLPVRGFASIPPSDRRDLRPKPFLAPVMYL